MSDDDYPTFYTDDDFPFRPHIVGPVEDLECVGWVSDSMVGYEDSEGNRYALKLLEPAEDDPPKCEKITTPDRCTYCRRPFEENDTVCNVDGDVTCKRCRDTLEFEN